MAVTQTNLANVGADLKPYLIEAIRMENEIQAILDDASQEMYDTIMASATSAGVQDSDALIAALIVILIAMLVLIEAAILAGVLRISTAKKKRFLDEVRPLLRAAKADGELRSFESAMGNFEKTMNVNFRTAKTGKYKLTFDDRMAGVSESSQRVLRNIVKSSVREGKSAQDIAKIVDRYMNPTPLETPTRPWDVIRNATKSTDKFIPQNVLKGSVQFNAYRIARSLSAESYREMTSRAFDSRKWVLGFRWLTSSRHVPRDICDEHEEHGVYDKKVVRPTSHDNCLCDWVPELMTVEQVRELLINGEI